MSIDKFKLWCLIINNMSIDNGSHWPETDPGVPDVFLTADEMWAITWRASVLTPDEALKHPFVIQQYLKMLDDVNRWKIATAVLREAAPGMRAPLMPLAELLDQGMGSVSYVCDFGGEQVSENGIDPDFTSRQAAVALNAVTRAVLRAYAEHQVAPLPHTFTVPEDLV